MAPRPRSANCWRSQNVPAFRALDEIRAPRISLDLRPETGALQGQMDAVRERFHPESLCQECADALQIRHRNDDVEVDA
jgi:hypothetical protein